MIVLDASAMVEWLQQSPVGMAVQRRVLGQPDPLHAPHLLDIEVIQALRRQVRQGVMSEARAERALRRLLQAPCIRHEHYPLSRRIWELRNNISPYDAAYIALAEFLGATLVTCDGRLAAAPGHRARVDHIL